MSEVRIGQIERVLTHKRLTIHPLSDVHVGADAHERKKFAERLKWIADSDDSHRIITIGDLLNFANKHSKSFEHGAAVPNDEALKMVELLKPVSNRIDAMLDGNHEKRSFRDAGLRITQWMAAALNRPAVYIPRPSVLRYRFSPRGDGDNKRYRGVAKLFLHHGRGGGRRPGGVLNTLEDYTKLVPDADIYFMGHVHQQTLAPDEVHTGWPLRKHTRYYVCTGHYLGLEDYALEAAYKSTPAGGPWVQLACDPNDDSLRVTLSLGAIPLR